ncbi:gap junction beta-6 protein [Platysternon megacephalum]|uniref:Gap junction beta-6 protein n=1 Tax=Platysternon megacephalum TaxID=55544 RepID=A0A4D9EGU1_9SAUR|nr:gap junction beta-6 protein [Platysternon megacephalum]
MSPPAAGCCHVTGFKVENWKQNLRAIYQCFVWSGSAETRKRKEKMALFKDLPEEQRKLARALVAEGLVDEH